MISEAAQALYDNDPSAKEFGIELIEASATGATVRMTVTEAMCNGFAIGHGGITFLLADSAMAFASNAGGGTALASSASIDWLAAVNPGDVLTAAAVEANTTGRSSVWDIKVANQHGDPVAIVRGRTRKVRA